MKIQVGNIYFNRTKKYLSPCLKEYGKEFTEKVSGLDKLAIGIGDIIYFDIRYRLEEHLFILVDTKKDRLDFNSVLSWLKEHESYRDDYVYDDIHTGYQHMIVLKVPNNCVSAYYNFIDSKFSKMFTKQQLEFLFNQKRGTKNEVTIYKQTFKILTKSEDYKIQFLDKVNGEFGTNVRPEEFEGEYDFPIKEQEEIFNYEK